jgi:hypothetical protein
MADERFHPTRSGVKRRGILVAAAAVVAGIVARQTSVPVAAANYNLQGDTGLTFYNLANDRTLIFANGPFPASTPVLDVEVTGSDLTLGGDLAVAVKGASSRDAGVWGVSSAASKPGVYGTSLSSGTGIGVLGVGDAAGVLGQASQGTGMQGAIPTTSSATNTVAVAGVNAANGAGGIGVHGKIPTTSRAAGTIAVYGESVSANPSGIGVKGTSTNGVGASFQGGVAPLRLVPGTSAATGLSASGHQAGELYVTSDRQLCYFDGTTWYQVMLASVGRAVPPAAAPRPSTAGTATGPVQPVPPPRP